MLKLEITQPNVVMAVGDKEQEIKIGTIVEIEGDTVPNFLINKCRVAGGTDVTAITNNDADELAKSQAAVALLTDELAKSQEACTTLGTQLSASASREQELRAQVAKLEADLVEAKKPAPKR